MVDLIVFAVVGTVVVDQNCHRQRFSRAAAAGQSDGLTAGSLGNEATYLRKGQFHVRIEDLLGIVCGFHRLRVAASFGVLRMMGTRMDQPRDWIIRFIGQGRGRQHGKNHAEG